MKMMPIPALEIMYQLQSEMTDNQMCTLFQHWIDVARQDWTRDEALLLAQMVANNKVKLPPGLFMLDWGAGYI